MGEVFHGWVLDESVQPDAHLKQGDLIVFNKNTEDKNKDDGLKNVGIVVTADCDLKNHKHAHLVTMVPVVEISTILERYLIIDACQDSRKAIVKFACEKFNIDSGEHESIILSKLRLAVKDTHEDGPEFTAANFALRKLDSISYKKYSELMKAMGQSPKKAKSFNEKLKKRGDIVLLPSANKLSIKGDIAWVRQIWQTPISNIAIRTSDVPHCSGERIARLDSPYRYRLTQVMSQVFADIGLPENDRDFEEDIEGIISNG